MKSEAIVVLMTTPNIEEADALARKIIEAKLAACVQVLPPMKSFYVWENEIQVDSEHLLLIKTLSVNFTELKEFIQANHSYDVPEIIALKASDVAENYFDWMKNYLQ
ncbi:MAG TPA: divalent-cation tolerance protein CutA [Pyrinomonadaceae bacterium]|jgi:periplasmic divalent cation tolerance protein|nr:divalent-cation tolerance protein CutA [Pyrinomonadaceae bacterium]